MAYKEYYGEITVTSNTQTFSYIDLIAVNETFPSEFDSVPVIIIPKMAKRQDRNLKISNKTVSQFKVTLNRKGFIKLPCIFPFIIKGES